MTCGQVMRQLPLSDLAASLLPTPVPSLSTRPRSSSTLPSYSGGVTQTMPPIPSSSAAAPSSGGQGDEWSSSYSSYYSASVPSARSTWASLSSPSGGYTVSHTLSSLASTLSPQGPGLTSLPVQSSPYGAGASPRKSLGLGTIIGVIVACLTVVAGAGIFFLVWRRSLRRRNAEKWAE